MNLTTQTTINKTTFEMGKILATFEMGKIPRTRITSKIILLKKIKLQTIMNTMNNMQRISYFQTTHAIRTMTTKQQQKTQTTGYMKYQQIQRVSHRNMRVSREKLLMNSPKHRRTLITKLKKNK